MIDCKEKFTALCKGLEIRDSENLFKKTPEEIKQYGEYMTKVIKDKISKSNFI